MESRLTAENEEFQKNGFVIIRGLLNKEEITRLLQFLESDKNYPERYFEIKDSGDAKVNMTLWNLVPDDITGVLVRSPRIVDRMEKFLGDEVYHYHTKLSMKAAKTGGAFEWHQDYGYWYENGCLYPDMASVYVALDRADKRNGCLQVITGSHLLGRVDHRYVGSQVAADPERVKLIQTRLPVVHAELEPGDAVFFHSNTLHHSPQNKSEFRRWGLVVGYNTKSNNPVIKHHHPQYIPLVKATDGELLTCALTRATNDRDFLIKSTDRSTNVMEAKTKSMKEIY